jgi:Xaa-Pro aminopeptidase
MTNHELERVRNELQQIGADYALLSSGENVTYATHFEVPVDFGALATLSFAPPMTLIGAHDATACLLVGSFYSGWAKDQSPGFEVVSYEAINWFEPVNGRENFLSALRQMFKNSGLSSSRAKLAIEDKALLAAVLQILVNELPNIELIDAGAALTKTRMIKTERELDLLRFAADVNKAGHDELRRQTREAGKNEFDMWAAVMSAMEKTAGHTLMVFGELVTGTRCRMVSYPGGPKNVVTQPGDLALMDMSPRVNGYWSDCTNTMVIGDIAPTQKQQRYGVAAREAFYAAADALRPGRKAREAFEAAKATFAKHGLEIGHYAGHQIGVSVNEPPRLVPYDDTVIEPGMVFSIEPGAYEGTNGEVGARMEKTIIVHESGPELLCDFEWGF